MCFLKYYGIINTICSNFKFLLSSTLRSAFLFYFFNPLNSFLSFSFLIFKATN
nr:MAG TPA: hypothetical protein [Caudoviricetes sp.]